MEKIIEEIKAARVRAGLSITALARMAGASKNHLSQVEAGIKGASFHLLSRLALALRQSGHPLPRTTEAFLGLERRP